jgi:hypothetical protein
MEVEGSTALEAVIRQQVKAQQKEILVRAIVNSRVYELTIAL